MIFCIANKTPEEYTTTHADGVGLWNSYGQDPAVFGLLCLTSMVPFDYEPGFECIPPSDKLVYLEYGHLVEATLPQEVGGTAVRELVETLTPPEFLDIVSANDIDHLKVLEMYPDKRTSTLQQVVKIRVLQWRHHFRGQVKTKEGIVNMKFKSDLSPEEKSILDTWVAMYRSRRLAMIGGQT